MPTARLRGLGGVIFDFALPLAPIYIEQLAKGLLVPADDESADLLAPPPEPDVEPSDELKPPPAPAKASKAAPAAKE